MWLWCDRGYGTVCGFLKQAQDWRPRDSDVRAGIRCGDPGQGTVGGKAAGPPRGHAHGPKIVRWPVNLSQRSTTLVPVKWEVEASGLHPLVLHPLLMFGTRGVRLWETTGGAQPSPEPACTQEAAAPPSVPWRLLLEREKGDEDFTPRWTRLVVTENYPKPGGPGKCPKWNGTWKF